MVLLFNLGGDSNLKGWIILRDILQGLILQTERSSLELLPKLLLLASIVLKFIQKS